MRLFIRTEASSRIGLGHFMRCFALAEEAREQGIEVTFLLNEIGETVEMRLAQIGAKGLAVDGALGGTADFMALGTLGLTRQDWLLIDSYAASEDYIAFQKKAARVAVIDDLNALDRFDCDLLINPAQAARRVDYERKSQARLLLGADYALIRKEFCRPRMPAEDQPFIIVMFGGSDPKGLTAETVRDLNACLRDTVTIRVIAGPANQHLDSLRQLAINLPRMQLHVSPESVAQILYGSALVITAAGGSVGEIAAMGLPALVLLVYDNQAAALKASPFPVIDARNGLPSDLGSKVRQLLNDNDRRKAIAEAASKIVDGEGPARIMEAMRHV